LKALSLGGAFAFEDKENLALNDKVTLGVTLWALGLFTIFADHFKL
jgi:hypothetical protein